MASFLNLAIIGSDLHDSVTRSVINPIRVRVKEPPTLGPGVSVGGTALQWPLRVDVQRFSAGRCSLPDTAENRLEKVRVSNEALHPAPGVKCYSQVQSANASFLTR
eukprot:446048-Hanusia_phi.AAC.1